MNLPTQDQVNAATRHIISAVGGAIVMFGLTSHISVDTLTTFVNALGSITNNVVLIVGIVAPIVAGFYASKSASAKSQAVSLEKSGATVVTTPQIAAETPNSPNILSTTEVKVVNK